MPKQILSALAIGLTFAAYFPYIRSIFRGQTKPHFFSWLIWGIATVIVCGAQLADGAGAGAWSIGISGLITLYVAALAYRLRADYSITRMDWVFLILALGSLPLWFFTSNPLWAVLILTAVDTLGFGPTFRKAYRAPFEEPLTFYGMIAVRNLISIAALEHFSITTLFFQAVMGFACIIFILMVLMRRRYGRT